MIYNHLYSAMTDWTNTIHCLRRVSKYTALHACGAISRAGISWAVRWQHALRLFHGARRKTLIFASPNHHKGWQKGKSIRFECSHWTLGVWWKTQWLQYTIKRRLIIATLRPRDASSVQTDECLSVRLSTTIKYSPSSGLSAHLPQSSILTQVKSIRVQWEKLFSIVVMIHGTRMDFDLVHLQNSLLERIKRHFTQTLNPPSNALPENTERAIHRTIQNVSGSVILQNQVLGAGMINI